MKHFFVTAVLTLCALSATAHYKDCPHWEEIQSKKIAHINEKVQFTVNEAKLFWPLYNEYLEKESALKKEFFEKQKKGKESNKIDYEELNDALILHQQALTNLHVEYYNKYKQILSAEKLYRYYSAERSFKKVLLESIEKKN